MQSNCVLCLGSSAFLIVDSTFQGQWHIFGAGHQECSGKFACFANHASLAICKGATVEVLKARCDHCSSKRCLSFGANAPRSLQQMRLCKNHNSGTATSPHCAVQSGEVTRYPLVFPRGFRFAFWKIWLSHC